MLRHSLLLLAGLSWLSVQPVTAEDSATFVAQAASQTVKLSGFTRARRELAVVSEASGRCTKVYADLGDVIPSNGILACLDDTFIRLDQQANQVDQQRLSAEVAYYAKEIKRLKQLTKANSAAQADLDRMEWNRDSSYHQLQALKVAAQRLAEQQQRTCIRAPAAWRVMQRNLEVGQWVTSGQVVAQTGDYHSVLVPLAVSTPELTALQALDSIPLNFANSGETLNAHILRRSPAFDPHTRKTQVDLEVISSQLNHGGERVEIQLQLPGTTNVAEVPRNALLERYEDQYLSRPDGELVKVTLLGPAVTEGYVQVSGVQLIGNPFLRDVQN